MSRPFRLLSVLGLTLGLTSLLLGCATTGPAYQEVPIPAGKAVVYIYRPQSFLGAALTYLVYANQIPVVNLRNGGYLPYFSGPGKILFSAETETQSVAIIAVEAGKSYYLKGTLQMGILVGRPDLQQVPELIGRAEIVNCKLIAPGP
jgi:hypothetical protein